MEKAFRISSLNYLSSLGGCEPETQNDKKSKTAPALYNPCSENAAL